MRQTARVQESAKPKPKVIISALTCMDWVGLPNIWGSSQIFNHIWEGLLSYMTLQRIPSEEIYEENWFSFLSVYCKGGNIRIQQGAYFLASRAHKVGRWAQGPNYRVQAGGDTNGVRWFITILIPICLPSGDCDLPRLASAHFGNINATHQHPLLVATRSQIHERTFSLRFLGIILSVRRLEVSVYNVSLQTSFKLLLLKGNSKEENS